MEVERIGTQAFLAFGTGAVFAFVIPIGIAVVWCIAKKEKLTTVLVGAATFLTTVPSILVFAIMRGKVMETMSFSGIKS